MGRRDGFRLVLEYAYRGHLGSQYVQAKTTLFLEQPVVGFLLVVVVAFPFIRIDIDRQVTRVLRRPFQETVALIAVESRPDADIGVTLRKSVIVFLTGQRHS